MRVTQESYYRTFLSDIFRLHDEQFQIERHINTGYEVNRASEAPSYSVTIMDSQHLKKEVSQYRLNLEAASTWMTASEEHMSSLTDILQRAKELAEQMATGTIESLEHRSAASEVENIIMDLVSLANSQVEGDYIFSGTQTDTAAISLTNQASNPAALVTDSATGHDTVMSFYRDPSTGLYHLQLTREELGSTASVSFPNDNTLGDGPPALTWSFDAADWNTVQYPGADRAGIYRLLAGMTSQSSVVSQQAGEEFSWIGDSDVGANTFRTSAVLTITGGCTVEFDRGSGVDQYAGVTDAQDLVNRIAQNNPSDYFGYVDPTDSTKVFIVATGTTTFSTAANPVDPDLTVDQDLTAAELVSAINAGSKAQGVIQINGDHAGFPPAMTDRVSLDTYTWTWEQITGGTTLADAGAYAGALAGWINDHTFAYSATTISSGNDAVVQISARAAGSAGNVSMSVTGTTVVNASSGMFGGLDGTDTATDGSLYATGESALRLSTTIRCTVMDVDGSDVDVRCQWYDDDGILNQYDLTLSDDGQDNAQLIAGTGISLFRNSLDFHEGAVYDLEVGRYRGNEEDLAVNFNQGGTLQYNWTARDLLGQSFTHSLFGAEATAKDPTTVGALALEGAYRGEDDRDITFDVIQGGDFGAVPPDSRIVFRISYLDAEGQTVQENIALTGPGRENAAVIPVEGRTPRVDLTGIATDTTAASPAGITLDGSYTGLTSREMSFVVTDTSVSGNYVTVQASWLDDLGLSQSETLTFSEFGSDHDQAVPGSDGVEIYLDGSSSPGDYTVGDTFTHEIDLYPDEANGGLFFYVDNQTFATGDSFFYHLEKEQVHVLDSLEEWRYQLANGTAEQAQTQSQKTLEALTHAMENLVDYTADAGTRQTRIDVRQQVLEEHELYAAQNLEELQDVDLNETFLELQASLTAYKNSLKTISVIQDLFLAKLV